MDENPTALCNLVFCVECLRLVEYDDAIYEDDNANDNCMICLDCFVEKKLNFK